MKSLMVLSFTTFFLMPLGSGKEHRKFVRLSSDLVVGNRSHVLYDSMVDDLGPLKFKECFESCQSTTTCNLLAWRFEGPQCHHIKGVPFKNEKASDPISIQKPAFLYMSIGMRNLESLLYCYGYGMEGFYAEMDMKSHFKYFDDVKQNSEPHWNDSMFMALDMRFAEISDPWKACKRHCFLQQDCTMVRQSGIRCYLGSVFKHQDPIGIIDDGQPGQISRS